MFSIFSLDVTVRYSQLTPAKDLHRTFRDTNLNPSQIKALLAFQRIEVYLNEVVNQVRVSVGVTIGKEHSVLVVFKLVGEGQCIVCFV